MGVIVGIIAGLAVGAVAGALFAHGVGPRLWATLLGCVIFGGAIGALVGGYGSLESPRPGREPSDTARPIRDRPELTRDEAEG
jgi:ribose/xylose/arabinose/galactoside ABC-type transport system permease subunit